MTEQSTQEVAADEDYEVMLGSDNIKRLTGNLYRVRRKLVGYAKTGVAFTESGIKFGNPRWVPNSKGVPTGKGFDKPKMEDLKASIRDEGLENPLRLRIIDEGEVCFLEVMNGERRLRCIDALIAENAMCVDPAHPTKARRPAKELFEWVDVRVNRFDEMNALRISLRPNDTTEGIGEVASINIVKVMRAAGCDDEEIIKITNKSVTWLRETDKLISLDGETLKALHVEDINRKVALSLTEITDVDKRLQKLEQLRQSAVQRIAQREQQIRQGVKADQAAAEIEAATAKMAEKDGDAEAAEKHRLKAAEAAERAEKKAAEAEALQKSPKTATVKDLDATKNSPEDIGSRPWTSKKIEKHWLQPLQETINNHGLDEEGNDLELNVKDCKLVVTFLEAMLEGKGEDGKPLDPHIILRDHKANG